MPGLYSELQGYGVRPCSKISKKRRREELACGGERLYFQHVERGGKEDQAFEVSLIYMRLKPTPKPNQTKEKKEKKEENKKKKTIAILICS